MIKLLSRFVRRGGAERARYAGVFLLSAGFLLPAAAQTPEGAPEEARRIITPEEAVRSGIENNLSLERNRVSVGTKKRVANRAWNQFLPAVDVSAALQGNVLASESQGADVNTWTLVAPQGQIGWTGLNFALFEGLRKLKLDYESGAVSYDKAQKQLERDIRKAYYNILLLQAQIDLLRQSYANAQRQEDSARANYLGGLAPQLYWMQAQVSRENLKPSIDQAETGLRLSKANFALNLGIEVDGDFDLVPVSLSTDFIPLDLQDMLTQAANNKPDIHELKAQLAALRSARKAAAYQFRTPSLGLSWRLGLNSTHINAMNGSTQVLNEWRDSVWSDTFTLSLGWRLNGLLPFTTETENLLSLDDSIRATQIGLAQTVQATKIEVYNTIFSLEQARVSAEAGRETVNLAQRTYDLTLEAFQAGLQTQLEVQNADLQLRQARTALLQQQVNFLTGLIDLEYAAGIPFGEILSTNTPR